MLRTQCYLYENRSLLFCHRLVLVVRTRALLSRARLLWAAPGSKQFGPLEASSCNVLAGHPTTKPGIWFSSSWTDAFTSHRPPFVAALCTFDIMSGAQSRPFPEQTPEQNGKDESLGGSASFRRIPCGLRQTCQQSADRNIAGLSCAEHTGPSAGAGPSPDGLRNQQKTEPSAHRKKEFIWEIVFLFNYVCSHLLWRNTLQYSSRAIVISPESPVSFILESPKFAENLNPY